MPLLSCLSWIILLLLNPGVHSFAYSGWRREEYEVPLCSSPIGESIVSAFRLISLGFFSPLWWITWWICPPWRVPSFVKFHSIVNLPYIVKGLRVSGQASVTCSIEGSSFVPLEVACGDSLAAGSWVSASRESSFQASLGWGMLEDSLILHYFAGVNYYWLESSKCSSTIFSQFPGNLYFLICYTVGKFPSNTTWYWGDMFPVFVFSIRDTDTACKGGCPR